MEKEYRVYETFSPGPHIVRLAVELIEDLSMVNVVRFVKFDPQTEDNTGLYLIDSKEVIIDLGNILNNADLYKLGMHFIPAVFYTTLWTLFHEVEHAKMMEKNTTLREFSIIPEEELESMDDEFKMELAKLKEACEIEAQLATKEAVYYWETHNDIPPINEWGWLGEELIEQINNEFAQGRLWLVDELDALKQGAVANAEHILAVFNTHKDPDINLTANDFNFEIQRGGIGLKIEGVNYITALEFFALTCGKKETAGAARTVSMG